MCTFFLVNFINNNVTDSKIECLITNIGNFHHVALDYKGTKGMCRSRSALEL